VAKHNNPALISLIKALRIQAEDEGKGFIFHDDVDDLARPEGFASVEWVGSVEPIFAIDGDTWIDTTT
jgi:hypothetical protein